MKPINRPSLVFFSALLLLVIALPALYAKTHSLSQQHDHAKRAGSLTANVFVL